MNSFRYSGYLVGWVVVMGRVNVFLGFFGSGRFYRTRRYIASSFLGVIYYVTFGYFGVMFYFVSLV